MNGGKCNSVCRASAASTSSSKKKGLVFMILESPDIDDPRPSPYKLLEVPIKIEVVEAK